MAAYAAAAIAVLQMASAGGEAEALESKGRFEEKQLSFNKKIANINAADAISRGEEQVADFESEAKRLKGTQRANLAAQGISIDSGSAAAIQYETDKQIDTDIARIRNNAWREAWGYKVEATNLQTESQMTSLATKNAASATRTAGTLQAAGTLVSAYGGSSKPKSKTTNSAPGGSWDGNGRSNSLIRRDT
jgi:hypothetical protein